MGFNPPDWAAAPSKATTLEVHSPDGSAQAMAIDGSPYYVIGRDASQVQLYDLLQLEDPAIVVWVCSSCWGLPGVDPCSADTSYMMSLC